MLRMNPSSYLSLYDHYVFRPTVWYSVHLFTHYYCYYLSIGKQAGCNVCMNVWGTKAALIATSDFASFGKAHLDRYLFSCKVFCSVDSHPHMRDLTKFEGWTDKETLGIHRPSCWNDFYCKRCMGHKSCSFYHHWMFVVWQYKIYFWTSSLYDYWYEIVYQWLGPSIYFWLCTKPLCRWVRSTTCPTTKSGGGSARERLLGLVVYNL